MPALQLDTTTTTVQPDVFDGVGSNSDAPPEIPEEDGLQEQIREWKCEQKIVEGLVQVYKNPTPTTTTTSSSSSLEDDELLIQLQSVGQRHDRTRTSCCRCAQVIAEDTPWCTVMKSLYRNEDETAEIDTDRKYLFGGVDIGWPNPPVSTTTDDHDDDDDDSAAQEEEPMAVAVYVIVDARTMEVVYRDHSWVSMATIPPYVSTFLSCREIDPLQTLVRNQTLHRPDLTPVAILVDGNGIFHPRRSGIACFLGVRTNIPTIGIAKTLLYIGRRRNEDASDEPSSQNNNNNDDEEEEYQWTRHKLDERIDTVLPVIRQRILSRSETEKDVVSSSNIALSLAQQFKKHKGLILTKEGIFDPIDEETVDPGSSREKLLQELSPFCNGIAIPLEAPKPTNPHALGSADDRFRVLGAALIGHGGGRSKAVTGGSSSRTSKRPIIVSVGHKLSLAEAVSIAASLSIFRIPEPIRQADLYGRELLRERKML